MLISLKAYICSFCALMSSYRSSILLTSWHLFGSQLRRTTLLVAPIALIAALSEIWIVLSLIPLSDLVLGMDPARSQPRTSAAALDQLNNFAVTNTGLFLIIFAVSIVLVTITRASCAKFLLRWAFCSGSQVCNAYMKSNLFATLEKSLSFSDNEAISIYTSLGFAFSNGFFLPFTRLLASIFQASILLVILSFLAGKVLVYVGTSLALCYILINSFNGRLLKSNGKKLLGLESALIESVKKALSSRRDLILYGIHDKFMHNIQLKQEPLRRLQLSNGFMSAYPKYALEGCFLLALSILLHVLFAYGQNKSDNLTQSLIIFIISLQKLLPAAQAIYSSLAEMQSVAPALSSTLSFITVNSIDFTPSLEAKSPTYTTTDSLIDIVGDYCYPTRNNVVLAHMSLKIHDSDKLLIKGSSGSGKSTLVDILMGFIGSNRNLLLNPRYRSLSHYQNDISHVPQFPFFYAGSIIDNITLGRVTSFDQLTPSDKDKVLKLRDVCCLSEFIKKSTDFDAILSDSHKSFSGGQLQRLAIARSLFKEASIFVLDEATRALDRPTETQLAQNLVSYLEGKTLIIISHSSCFDALVNRIITVENGIILESV